MWGDIHFTDMQERLRAQQRALRQSRRARPLDTRRIIDRRLQQEARRMGISPEALYQYRVAEHQRIELLQKQAKDLTSELSKLKYPVQLEESIKTIPREILQYMNVQAIMDKVIQDYQAPFNNKIAQLSQELQKVQEQISRSGISPGLAYREEYAYQQISILGKMKGQGNVDYNDALAYAQQVGKAQANYRAEMESYYRRLAKGSTAPSPTVSAPKALEPTITFQDIPPTYLTPRQVTPEQPKPTLPARIAPITGVIRGQSYTSQTIINALKKIFG